MRNLWLVVLLLLHRSHYVYSNAEGDALHDFKSQLTDPHNVLQSWNATFVNPCTWFHVTCDNDNYVIRVDLGNAQLSGPLVSSLGKITRLQYLELYGNNLMGSIPAELGNLSNLISLDLYQNNFTSVIPDTLGNLLKLRYLRLNNNSLSGSIPVSLTNINNLQILDLSNNNLSGSVPTNGSFSHFTSISFQNNPHLCGQAVNKQCPGEPPLASPPSYSPGSPNCSQGGQS